MERLEIQIWDVLLRVRSWRRVEDAVSLWEECIAVLDAVHTCNRSVVILWERKDTDRLFAVQGVDDERWRRMEVDRGGWTRSCIHMILM